MESAPINKGNNKKSLFACFKPDMSVVDDDDDSSKPARKRQKGNSTTDPVLAYLSSADEDGIVVSSEAEAETGGVECRNRRRKKGKGTWHSLRKTLNETKVIKKILIKWKTRKKSMSRSNSHAEITKMNGKHNATRRTNSNASSTLGGNSSAIFTPSSSLSSTSSSSRTDHMSGSSSHELNSPPLNGTSRQNSVEDRRKRKCGSSNKALCMLLIISLLVLICWGKFLAILCTSVWFYLLPLSRRRRYKEEVSCVEESNEFDSVQYKKKVIYGRNA